MEPLQIAVLMSHQSLRGTQAWSALPDAPQVPYVAVPSVIRDSTSKALFRLACRIAPAPRRPVEQP